MKFQDWWLVDLSRRTTRSAGQDSRFTCQRELKWQSRQRFYTVLSSGWLDKKLGTWVRSTLKSTRGTKVWSFVHNLRRKFYPMQEVSCKSGSLEGSCSFLQVSSGLIWSGSASTTKWWQSGLQQQCLATSIQVETFISWSHTSFRSLCSTTLNSCRHWLWHAWQWYRFTSEESSFTETQSSKWPQV